MADILEDPTDMNDATERVEQRPSEAPIEPLAAAEPEPRTGPPVEPVEAPAERRSPRQLLLKITAEQFDLAASLSPEEFKTAFNNGVRAVLDMQAAKAVEVAPQSGAGLLQAAE